MVVILLSVFSINVEGADLYNNAFKKSRRSSSGGPQFLLGAGSSTFLGDLGGKPTLGSDDISDIDLSTIRYVVSAGLRIPFSRTIALRLTSAYTRLGGDDKYTINPERRGRNLNFKTGLFEGSVALEFSFGSNKRFYCYGGIGYALFKPFTTYNGTKVYLQPLGTEGQNYLQGKQPYGLTTTIYPFGLGYRIPAGSGQITFELAMRKSTTDYIDDVSTKFADPALVAASAPSGSGATAAALADRSISDIPGFSSPGSIRGDPTDNDNYFFIIVYYHFPLSSGGNNGSFGSKGKRGKGNFFGTKRKCIEF